ncbi:MAG: hypothetical protein EBR83_03030 [Verrucomicrobia bacterium]|nr:hypothetical protein [Verrucomicrobiota bacterium]
MDQPTVPGTRVMTRPQGRRILQESGWVSKTRALSSGMRQGAEPRVREATTRPLKKPRRTGRVKPPPKSASETSVQREA